ncbi:ABC transporter permease [Clostridium thermosuccinogenes]|jgi:putative aldouronate transport system permease protein|uniref:ABC transporter permease n=1 Tax=Clostridium thermosuccinogenes TaxID=84032 RepID=A0A2K2FQ28_9CLOT|nr:carbohydrate ABC transporter permease [Pseudoclostridium thermosuccinogenes]AUS98371.1 ABC transporter permease [Pseudoclostridium thermosuccinogenes]PNT98949.1 ABC transporter permease [Pseudoclostridium thermosuccinogenes]PNU00864.1 ABC transporter permease [Pseudoclostridium thermosuccinogenes]
MKRRKTFGDRLFDTINILIMVIIVLATLYPFINSAAISLNDANDTTKGGITFYPRVFTLRNYELIFTNPKVYNAYLITIARTVIGTISALLFTSMLAFGMAHRNLKGRRFYTILCIIPMYFGGGLIPYYFLIKGLGMMNSFWVYIIPSLVGIWNMILMRTYFMGIPSSLEESARIDGANYFTVFFRIIFPVSMPIVATIALFIGVGQWNAWFDASMFITKQELKPMQTVLLSIISEAKFAQQLAQTTAGAAADASNIGKGVQVNVRSITMATMIVTILPIIMVYPFLQRYFVKGIMIGSLKG